MLFDVPIAGNFRGRKLSRIGQKYDFCGENFRGLLACAVPKDATPTKTAKFVKVFSLESYPLKGVVKLSCVALSY